MRGYFTGSTLKIIAVLFMVLDHVGQIVLKNGIAMKAPYSMFTDKQFSLLLTMIDTCHILGRLAFPVFCFMIVEGFLHTHNMRRYLKNLFVCAAVSEPVYDLAFAGEAISPRQQNVIWCLMLGLIVLIALRRFENNFAVLLIIISAGAFLSYICRLDGAYYGILLISAFYMFHEKPLMKFVSAVIVMFVCGLDFSAKGIIDPYFLTAVSAMVLIMFYNGSRGIKMKHFFYIFYPAHLLILIITASVLTAAMV